MIPVEMIREGYICPKCGSLTGRWGPAGALCIRCPWTSMIPYGVQAMSKILYCRHHDLGYCEKHGSTPCFSPTCKLEEEPACTFCAICSGMVAAPVFTEKDVKPDPAIPPLPSWADGKNLWRTGEPKTLRWSSANPPAGNVVEKPHGIADEITIGKPELCNLTPADPPSSSQSKDREVEKRRAYEIYYGGGGVLGFINFPDRLTPDHVIGEDPPSGSKGVVIMDNFGNKITKPGRPAEKTFRNVWPKDFKGPAAQCTQCGTIVHSFHDMLCHSCPGEDQKL